MPDEAFPIKGVKKNSAAYTQKLSVLWPIISRRSLYDSDVVLDTTTLLRRWRKRVDALHAAKWPELQADGKVQFVRNCPPAGIVIGKENDNLCQCCKLRAICPWCYMRQVAKVFNAVAKLLPNRGATQLHSINVLEISGEMLMCKADAGSFLSGHLTAWQQVPQKLLRRLKPLGAYRTISLDPKAIDGHKSLWRFRYHILAIVPNNWTMPDWLDNGNRKVRTTNVTSKKQLINTVQRTCRYPIGLFRGTISMTIKSLNARRGKRCNEFTGCLRTLSRRSNK
jgi:hypothetical protein